MLDDGRGIDRARVLRQARAAGVVDEALETLGDDQLLKVLSRSGFSTAITRGTRMLRSSRM